MISIFRDRVTIIITVSNVVGEIWCYGVLCFPVCCGVLRCLCSAAVSAVCCGVLRVTICCGVLRFVVVCCGVLQCVTVCYSNTSVIICALQSYRLKLAH